MSLETADAAADFIRRRSKGQPVRIEWFGGEPLYNLPVIDRICERLDESGVDFFSIIITNGYLFDDAMVQKAVKLWKLKAAQITLDGTEAVYNRTKAFIYPGVNAYQTVKANIGRLLDAGINVCLGTDGPGSNNSLNMFQEMNAAALAFKGANHAAQCVDAADVLKMATENGAKAIGREGELGAVREGALADLVLVNLNEPQFMPANNIVSGLVYSATGAEVDTVLVDGKVLMEGRKLTTIDEQKVYGEIRKIAERLTMNG
jgi:hypothetical protein